MKKLIINSFVFIGLCIGLSSCYYSYDNNDRNSRRIQAEGPQVERVFELSDFEGIVIQNSATVYLTQGKNQKVEVEASENILRNLSQEVSGGVWRIKNRKPVWRNYDLIIRITLPKLSLVKISGSGTIETRNTFENLGEIEVRLSGSGRIDLDLDANEVLARIGGSGSIHLAGDAKRVNYGVSGSGSIQASELQAREGTARISGSGGIKIYTTEDLEARITGSGNILYFGHPSVDSSVSGSGHISSR